MTEASNNEYTYSIPDLLKDSVTLSKIYINHGVMERETSFGINLSLPEMRLSATLQSRELELLPGKIEATLHKWEKKYKAFLAVKDRERKADSVEDMNAEARSAINELRGILAHTLDVHDAVDWDSVKRKEDFRANPDDLVKDGDAPDWIQFDDRGQPVEFAAISMEKQPTMESVKSEYGVLDRLLKGDKIKQEYEAQLSAWNAKNSELSGENDKRNSLFQELQNNFEIQNKSFEEEKHNNNVALDNIRNRYQDADPKAVEEYCDLVMSSSSYPDYFPRSWLLEYHENNKTLIINYELPSSQETPRIESYKYVEESDSIRENLMPDADRDVLYNELIYQIVIRTPHELFEADVVNALDKIIFNGHVNIINRATGSKETRTIVSVAAGKAEFLSFDLSQVEPKATFDHLKGVIDGVPAELKSVSPIVEV